MFLGQSGQGAVVSAADRALSLAFVNNANFTKMSARNQKLWRVDDAIVVVPDLNDAVSVLNEEHVG